MMNPPQIPSPTKKRKQEEPEISACNKKKMKSSFRQFFDDRKKNSDAVSGGLHDVNVAFCSSSEVTLLAKKEVKIENTWSGLQPETREILQTRNTYLRKRKIDMTNTPDASHSDYIKKRPRQSSHQCSTSMLNLQDLLPSSQFYSVKKRTPLACKNERLINGSNSCSSNGHDSESKSGVAANWDAFSAVPMPAGGAQSGVFPLASQFLGRATTERDVAWAKGKKLAENGVLNWNFKSSMLDGESSKARSKVTKAYSRSKCRKPFFKYASPDFYALHLLADTALGRGPGEVPE